jgi:hypothetical protein
VLQSGGGKLWIMVEAVGVKIVMHTVVRSMQQQQQHIGGLGTRDHIDNPVARLFLRFLCRLESNIMDRAVLYCTVMYCNRTNFDPGNFRRYSVEPKCGQCQHFSFCLKKNMFIVYGRGAEKIVA